MKGIPFVPTLKRRKPVLQYWLTAAGMVSVLFACIVLFGDLRYANNDDGCILRAFMGFKTPDLPTFHLYLNALLVYPLRWLGLAFPGVAWFSYMQLAFLWLACTVSAKCILRRFDDEGHSAWLGAAAAVSYLLVFAMTYCCHITYTVTADMLGAAAVFQALSVDAQRDNDKQVVRGMVGALLLTVLAYSLRQITALPILAFCALVFIYQMGARFGWGKKRSLRPLWVSAAVVVAVMAVLAGTRELEIKAKGMDDYLRWQRARITVMDYTGMDNLPDDLLAKIGWTRSEAKLVGSWYFLDTNITAEALETIAAYEESQMSVSLIGKAQNAAGQVADFFANEPLGARSVWILCALTALAFTGLIWKRGGRLGLGLTLAATVLLTAGMLFYLGWSNRLPLRAAMTALLPASALIYALLPACLPVSGSNAKVAHVALGVFAAAVLALTAWYAVPAAQALVPVTTGYEEEGEITNAFADLDEYALDNPDLLLIYDATFISDTRMFPATQNGIPTNVMFWGGWDARSPEYVKQLAAFGLDAQNMDATVFFKDNVRLVRGTLDPPPDQLIAYLKDLYGEDFDYTFDDDWGGAHMLQFYTFE
jgi:hypothetical protein